MTTIIEYLQSRNCFKCGQEFRGEVGKRVCPNCAPPKEIKRPLTTTLSFRERQVVHLISKGNLNKEIAYKLHLTEGTVKEYLNRIFRKVGSTNRTELAVWAITQGCCFVDAGANGDALGRLADPDAAAMGS